MRPRKTSTRFGSRPTRRDLLVYVDRSILIVRTLVGTVIWFTALSPVLAGRSVRAVKGRPFRAIRGVSRTFWGVDALVIDHNGSFRLPLAGAGWCILAGHSCDTWIARGCLVLWPLGRAPEQTIRAGAHAATSFKMTSSSAISSVK